MVSLSWFRENLEFLILEVLKQLDGAQAVIEDQNAKAIEKINVRDDHIDNLKGMIENRCYGEIVQADPKNRELISLLRGLNTVSSNLEKVADYSVNIVNQTGYLRDKKFFIDHYEYRPFFKEVKTALKRISKAIFKQDISLALKICACEFKLDHLYGAKFKKIIEQLDQNDTDSENLVTSLFIFHYLERMGDSILNIGEAIIFTVLGEKLKIHQYRGLANTLNGNPQAAQMQDYTFQSIWGTRSGCRIGRIFSETPDQNAVFKEGLQDKLHKEKENIEEWNRLFPGITAKIFGYEEKNRNATLLLEHLPGLTIKEIALNDNPGLLAGALRVLERTVAVVWRETKRARAEEVTFADQLIQRLDDVYKVHPELKTVSKTIGTLKAPSFREQLERMRTYCHRYPAPFSVRIHGDFNIDNILYNQEEDRIHFVDLHRSGQADYVQDISVFLVSNFRIPIEHGPIRNRLNHISLEFMKFARSFARELEDATFEVRLALGLVRSFTTSTRFVLDKAFAKDLFLRAVYLLDSLEAVQDRGEEYALAEEILVD